jgi:hypothetical protein
MIHLLIFYILKFLQKNLGYDTILRFGDIYLKASLSVCTIYGCANKLVFTIQIEPILKIQSKV